jgi:hypothetical protein
LASQARLQGITLGNAHEIGDHALLLDREDQKVCVVYREEAQEFLARRSATAA